jgi:chemotaxis protein methyltransferase CheR
MNPAGLLTSASYRELKRQVLEYSGLSYYFDRDEDLAARMSRRLVARGCVDAGTYLQLLRQDPAEFDCLVGELTIGETYFFRQPEQFTMLRDTILPEILERKRPTSQLRIWSAGCATGAEPYSLSILLRLEFGPQIEGWDVSILATDINVEFLAQAREGLFGAWALRETPQEIKARCFEAEGKRWRLRPEFARQVVFQHHNLMSAATPSLESLPFDLIVCRNVLIYFSQDTILAVARNFFETLTPGGWLLVGHAEPNQQTFAMFQALTSPIGTAYRKAAESLSPTRSIFTLAGLSNAAPVGLPPSEPPVTDRSRCHPAAAPVVGRKPPQLQVHDVRILADRGNWKLARDAANQLVNDEPLNASAHFTLGLILEHGGENDAARDTLRKAIYLDRSFALAHYHLGILQQLSGDEASAGRSFSTVLRLVDSKPGTEPLPHGDGITAAELGDLAKMHLELSAK